MLIWVALRFCLQTYTNHDRRKQTTIICLKMYTFGDHLLHPMWPRIDRCSIGKSNTQIFWLFDRDNHDEARMACQPFRRLQQLHATFKTDKGCTEIVVATITYGSNFSIVFL